MTIKWNGAPEVVTETCYKIHDYDEQVCKWICEPAEQPAEVEQKSTFDEFVENFGRIFLMRMRAGFNLGLFWSE